jgi:hypothetical protein
MMSDVARLMPQEDPSTETKNQKFRRLAQDRTNRVLFAIGPLYRLSGPAYESSVEERRRIIETLHNAVDALEEHFFREKARAPYFSFE